MMEDFSGKVVLITGSSAGIGAGIAVHFAGLKVRGLSLTGRDDGKLQGVAKRCLEAGLKDGDILTTTGDLTDDSFRRQLVQATIDKFGSLDILVNNAGMVKEEQLSDASMDVFHSTMALNLEAHVAMSKLAIPYLLRSKGNIVNISSLNGFKPALSRLGSYCMSKAALDMFTKCLALELATSGVRVNTVSPGVVRSEVLRDIMSTPEQYKAFLEEQGKKQPVGRIGEPEDIARAVAFLASDKNSFITGELLVVDGGARYGSLDSEFQRYVESL